MNKINYLIVAVLLLSTVRQSNAQVSVGNKNNVGIITPSDTAMTLKIISNYSMSGPRQNAVFNQYSIPNNNLIKHLSTSALTNNFTSLSTNIASASDSNLIISNGFLNNFTANSATGDWRYHRGISNIMNSNGVFKNAGIYNNSTLCGFSEKSGIYNFTSICNGASITGTSYKPFFGIYNYLLSNYARTEGNPALFRAALFSGINTPSDTLGIYAGYFQGNVAVVGNYLKLSDSNLKTNVNEITNALSSIRDLKPYSYFYNNNVVGLPTGLQYGLIAQDVQSIFPALVSESSYVTSMGTSNYIDSLNETNYSDVTPKTFSVYKNIDYISLIPILIKAVQELSSEVTGLKAQVAKLQSENKK